MKVCQICNQTYRDDEQNYCLNDGSVLTKLADDAPPTVFMDAARTTEQTNWTSGAGGAWQQPAPMQVNQPYSLASVQGKNQTLPTVALILGILGFVLTCCYGGVPFGIAAIITGYLGMNNASKDPMQYGGRNLAIAGLILGALGFFGTLMMIILGIIGSIGK